jgi:DNA-binding Lrp family transcriptional regulator
MITQKDLDIISHLRNNARRKITEVSRLLEIPVTTIYDKIKLQERKGILKKHTSLLDFSKLGFNTNVFLALSTPKAQRDALQTYLMNHPNVNSLYRVDMDHDILVEVVFENISKLHEFIDHIEDKFELNQIITFSILQELKKEGFLANPI